MLTASSSLHCHSRLCNQILCHRRSRFSAVICSSSLGEVTDSSSLCRRSQSFSTADTTLEWHSISSCNTWENTITSLKNKHGHCIVSCTIWAYELQMLKSSEDYSSFNSFLFEHICCWTCLCFNQNPRQPMHIIHFSNIYVQCWSLPLLSRLTLMYSSNILSKVSNLRTVMDDYGDEMIFTLV